MCLSSGDWLSWDSERWGRQLSEFYWWVKGLESVIRVLSFTSRDLLGFGLASRRGESVARILRGGYADARVCR